MLKSTMIIAWLLLSIVMIHWYLDEWILFRLYLNTYPIPLHFAIHHGAKNFHKLVCLVMDSSEVSLTAPVTYGVFFYTI